MRKRKIMWVRIQISFSPQTNERIREVADKLGISVSELIRRAVDFYIFSVLKESPLKINEVAVNG